MHWLPRALAFGALTVASGGCALFEIQGSYRLLGSDAGVKDTGSTGLETSARDAKDAKDAASGDAALETLAEGEAEPVGIVHVGSSLFWANASTKAIRTLTLPGTRPVTVATASPAPSDLATDGMYLYAIVGSQFSRGSNTAGACSDYVSMPLFMDAGGVLTCGHGNGAADAGEIYTSGDLAPCKRIALASSFVFEVSEGYFEFAGAKAPAPGGVGQWTGSEEIIQPGDDGSPTVDPGPIIADGVTIFAAFGPQIWKEPQTLDDEGLLVYQADPSVVIVDMVADETSLYWLASDGTLNSVAKTSADAGSGAVLAENLATPWRLALYEKTLYWTNRGGTTGPGSVASLPVSGGNVATLADSQAEPSGIFVDFSGVYWTNAGDGTIRRHSL